MNALQTLIVDDEEQARHGLRRLLEDDPEVQVVGACGDGASAVEAILDRRPALLFLDVQMPRMDGFEVVRAVEQTYLPLIVFTTAYDHYALQAFDLHAVDYLLKPFSNQRLAQAIEKAKTRVHRDQSTVALQNRLRRLLDHLDEPHSPASPMEPSYVRRLAVKQQERVTFVDVADIDWIEAADNYVVLHVGSRSHLLRATMTQMEEALDPDSFLRVHRSHIVNIDRIREMHPLGSGDCLLVLDDGTEVNSSRTYSARRRETLDPLSG